MLYALGVLIFAVGLLASIALHEVGHMVPAKKFGVKVTQYMVGFGPTAWSRKGRETEYGIKWIPLGGYIRMIGMVPPRADGTRSRWPRRMATAVEEFRRTSRAEVAPGDEDREFYRLTPGKKMIVMLGGPCMNLVIYLVIMVILLLTIGISHTPAPTLKINAIEKCVVAANSPAAATDKCPANAPVAPAYGRLKPGDTILAVDGKRVHTWDALVAKIEPSAGKQLHLLVNRHGHDVTVPITPAVNTVYANDQGTATKTAGFLGIEATQPPSYYKPASVTEVPGQIGSQISQGFAALGRYPSKIASLWQTVFDGKPRDPEGAVGIVGIGRLGGDVASSHGIDVQEKTYALFGLLASVNLLLFFFNLLPLLPLDGGHVAGAIVEAAKRGRARLRARSLARGGGSDVDVDAAGRAREAIYVDTAQMLPVMYAVASVLIVVTLLTFYADIVHPIRLGG
ncbi:MAG TPA: site-2 protease family protein [Jatrophihabitantaceae bacterium]|nr:site-2 protease family protein [Jatrophihabitantaceae bacterium]